MKFKTMLIVMLSLFSVNSFADLNDVVDLFKPENQQEVKQIILNKNQSENEVFKNIIRVLNKESDSNYLKIINKNGKLKLDIDPNTSIETLEDYSKKSNALFSQLLEEGNADAAMIASSVATTVEVTQATKKAVQSLKKSEKFSN